MRAINNSLPAKERIDPVTATSTIFIKISEKFCVMFAKWTTDYIYHKVCGKKPFENFRNIAPFKGNLRSTVWNLGTLDVN